MSYLNILKKLLESEYDIKNLDKIKMIIDWKIIGVV